MRRSAPSVRCTASPGSRSVVDEMPARTASIGVYCARSSYEAPAASAQRTGALRQHQSGRPPEPVPQRGTRHAERRRPNDPQRRELVTVERRKTDGRVEPEVEEEPVAHHVPHEPQLHVGRPVEVERPPSCTRRVGQLYLADRVGAGDVERPPFAQRNHHPDRKGELRDAVDAFGVQRDRIREAPRGPGRPALHVRATELDTLRTKRDGVEHDDMSAGTPSTGTA